MNTKELSEFNDAIVTNAYAICRTYNKGNGKFDGATLPSITGKDVEILAAIGVFALSKMDTHESLELIRMKAVSSKHANLLASATTGRYDFTAIYDTCKFISRIDSNLQQVFFKRESKSVKINLVELKAMLANLGLELIIETNKTRSGGEVTNYFYDIATTTTKGE